MKWIEDYQWGTDDFSMRRDFMESEQQKFDMWKAIDDRYRIMTIRQSELVSQMLEAEYKRLTQGHPRKPRNHYERMMARRRKP